MKDNHHEDAAIDETAGVIAAAIRKHVDRAQQRAKAELAEALSAADAERKAAASQHREALTQLVDARTQLKRSQQETEELLAERVDLQRELKDAIAAKAHAEAQYQELVAASQQLTDSLSRTLHQQREQVRAPIPPAAKKSEPVTPPRTASPVTAPPPESTAAAKKKPLQFSGPARDAKRVRLRAGTYVSVDGIPGELVDLSLGGAQAVLTQLVKPNQLVRLTAPTAGNRLVCKGRVVWVVYEQPGTSLSVYRMGVKFTDIDAKAVEDFMTNFSEVARPAADIA